MATTIKKRGRPREYDHTWIRLLIHDLVQGEARQIFHHVIEGAVGRVPIVVDLHGVPVLELGHRLHLGLEALEHALVENALGP